MMRWRPGRIATVAAAALGFLIVMVVTGAQPVQRQLVRFEARGVLKAVAEKVVRIELVRGGESLALVRVGESWTSQDGRLSEETKKRVVTAVRMMHASAPVREILPQESAGSDDAAFGLDAPQIIARLYDQPDRLILAARFGGPNPDGFLQYMRLDGDERLYLMSRFIGEEWMAAMESVQR
jgi:hypothetical protein